MSDLTLRGQLQGVSAVLVAPFHDGTGGINESLLSRLVARVDEAGIHVITALGNTAEAYQLTVSERHSILTSVTKCRGDAHLLAGLAGPLDEIVQEGQRVAALGYDGIMVHEPVDPFASSEGLERFYLELAQRLPLPLVLYIRSERLGADALLRILEHPDIIAIKYARTDLGELAALLRAPGAANAQWICGAAESMVPAFAHLGVLGFTSGLANVRPDLTMGIWRASRDHEWEALSELVSQILPFELMRTCEGGRYNVSVLKRALAWQGWHAGGVRPPYVDLDPAHERGLRELLESWPAEQVQG